MDVISDKLGHRLKEFHTRHFYAGNGIWRNLSGVERSEITSYFIDWFVERKHHVVFSAIDKAKYQEMRTAGQIHTEIDTLWKAMGFHVALAVQRNFQTEAKNKGNTIFVFDEEVIEEPRFQQLILSPPSWSDTYYSKQKSQKQLCQVVDAPYFANSKNVILS